MIKAIVIKELKEIFRQRIFQILGGILVLLSISALLVSFGYQKSVNRQIAAANDTARLHWESQSEKNQHSAAHYGVYIFKPKSAFSFWDPGIEKFVGSTIFIEPHGRNRPKFAPIEDSPLLARWGELTPSFVFLVLLPLFIIWISSGAISSEKEFQTLNFALSQGVTWRQFLIGKVCARWLIVLGFCLPLFIAMVLMLQFAGGTGESGIMRWILLFTVYLGFMGIFIHLTIALSARIGKTTSATVIMIGFWLISVWGAPRLAAYAGAAIHPADSAWSFDSALESEIDARGIRRHDPNNANLKAFQQDLMETYGVENLENLPVNYAGLSLLESEKQNDVVIDEKYANLFENYSDQMTTVQMFGFLSPFLTAHQLSMGICKTDVHNFIHFQKEADAYRKDFNVTLNNDLVKSGISSTVRSESFWREVPEFRYEPLSTLHLARHYWISFLIMFLWFIASMGFLFTVRLKKN